MSVRKREWRTRKGEEREAWVVDYVDQHGTRTLKTFERKKEAEAFAAASRVEVRDGTHVADSASVTVKEAGDLWIQSAEAAELERTTVDQYRQHLRLHIEPFIGRTLLSKMNVPTVRAFEDKLRTEKRSPTMAKYVVRSLGALLADAQERGLIVRNPVRELRGKRRNGKKKDRHKQAPKVGVDIPTPEEIKRIVNASTGRGRPFILTAIFSGLRSSELRGLRWQDVDLRKSELHVRQRADRFGKIDSPKTYAGTRTVPLPPIVVTTLREWKLKCPKGKLDLVFPNGEGNVEFHVNIVERVLKATLIAAGVTTQARDADGALLRDEDDKPIMEAKYTGLHALRHFYASWCINRKRTVGSNCHQRSSRSEWGTPLSL